MGAPPQNTTSPGGGTEKRGETNVWGKLVNHTCFHQFLTPAELLGFPDITLPTPEARAIAPAPVTQREWGSNDRPNQCGEEARGRMKRSLATRSPTDVSGLSTPRWYPAPHSPNSHHTHTGSPQPLGFLGAHKVLGLFLRSKLLSASTVSPTLILWIDTHSPR